MRTTLDIDEEVLRVAKELARRSKSTAGKVISELARQALTGRSEAPSSVGELPAFYGFRARPAGDRLVSEEAIDRLREKEGV